MPRAAANEIAANVETIRKWRRTRVEKQTEYVIKGEKGLSLVVKPSGVASFSVRYTFGPVGKKKSRRVVLGRYEDMTLEQAKQEAFDIRSDIRQGVDKKAGPDDLTTLRQLFDAFEKIDTKRAVRTMSDYREHLERNIFPEIGDEPLAEITSKEIARVLTKVEARSKSAAHHTRSALGSLYKWATARFLVDHDPVKGMGFTHKGQPRKPNLTDDTMAAIWTAIDSDECAVTPGIKIILKLAILTGQRNTEVSGATKSELQLNLANPRWIIPAERMKRKTEDQVVFLSPQATELFKQALKLSTKDEKFVFPGSTHGRRKGVWRKPHVAQESVSKAMASVRELAGVQGIVLHDFRKFMTTWLAERGERPDVLDRLLHHGSTSVTSTHYNFATMEEWLRPAWAKWADHIDAVLADEDKANVGPLRQAV